MVVALSIAVVSGGLDHLDEAVRAAVVASRTPSGIKLMLWISHLSSEYGTPLTVLAIAALVYRGSRLWAGHLLAVSLTSTLWQIGLKHLIERPRPLPPLVPYWTGAGYPSGHVLTAVCLVLLLWAYCEWARSRFAVSAPKLSAIRTALVAWPLLVACSRVYIDAHWLSDVVAGALLGLMHFMTWYYVVGWQLRVDRCKSS